MYDAIIVGARCAGSPVGMLLARKGYKVLLVDKGAFPSDIMSTHYIHQMGTAKLQQWGLLDRVAASNCPPMTAMRFDVGPFALLGTPPPADGVAAAYCPRRTVIDTLLVNEAVAAGAELRENFTVDALCMEGDRVTGIRGHARGGATVTERARIVIGADGLHSVVAKGVKASTYHEVPALTCGYYAYWSNVPSVGAELYPRDGRFIVAFPTNDNLTCIAVQWTHKEFHQYRTDIEGHFMQTLALAPELAERVQGGTRESRFVGTADLPNFFRVPYGLGWALVGDAGYHQDPNTGQGISNAFRDAELLADAVDAGFSGRMPLDAALAGYEQRRNADAMPRYDFTMQIASLEPPPPDMQQLFGALRGNQADTNRFFGLVAGTTAIPEFFAPENMERIMKAAASEMVAAD
jgi:flavin-dependent dehydrogenase